MPVVRAISLTRSPEVDDRERYERDNPTEQTKKWSHGSTGGPADYLSVGWELLFVCLQ